MKKFLYKWIPMLWAALWVIAITTLSFGIVWWSIKWILTMTGVLA